MDKKRNTMMKSIKELKLIHTEETNIQKIKMDK